MSTRNHEYLPIARIDWIETSACLTQQALRAGDRAELLRAMVSHYPDGQVSQPYSIAASQQHGPQMPRQGRGWNRNVREVRSIKRRELHDSHLTLCLDLTI